MPDMTGELPMVLVKELIHIGGGREKTLKCQECNKFRKHVSVSTGDIWKETFGKIGGKALGKIGSLLGRLNDIFPPSVLVYGVAYVCTKCGRWHLEDGIISDWSDPDR